MPQDAPKLADAEIAHIADWIDRGPPTTMLSLAAGQTGAGLDREDGRSEGPAVLVVSTAESAARSGRGKVIWRARRRRVY